MNSYLHAEKMYVRDITEDLQDGQLLLSFLGTTHTAHRGPHACRRGSSHTDSYALEEKLVKVSLPIALGAQAMSAKRANLLTAFKVLQNQCELEVDDAWIDGSVQPSGVRNRRSGVDNALMPLRDLRWCSLQAF